MTRGELHRLRVLLQFHSEWVKYSERSDTRLDLVEGWTGYLADLSGNQPLKFGPHGPMRFLKIQREKKSRRLRTIPCDLLEHSHGKGRLPSRYVEPMNLGLMCLFF